MRTAPDCVVCSNINVQFRLNKACLYHALFLYKNYLNGNVHFRNRDFGGNKRPQFLGSDLYLTLSKSLVLLTFALYS